MALTFLEAGQLLTLEAANLFAGVTEPGSPHASNHLRLVNVKLPGMIENYVDHSPGGSLFGVEVDVQLAKLQCDFTLAGWSVQTASLIQAWQWTETMFWVFGVLRDRFNGTAYQIQAQMDGRLGRADPEAWSRGRVHNWDYSIRSIMAYQLMVGGRVIWDWSFSTNSMMVGTLNPISEPT